LGRKQAFTAQNSWPLGVSQNPFVLGLKIEVQLAPLGFLSLLPKDARQLVELRKLSRGSCRGSVALVRFEQKCAKSPIDFAGIFRLSLPDFSPMQRCLQPTVGKDWRVLFPVLAAYSYDLFDYRSEDFALAQLR